MRNKILPVALVGAAALFGHQAHAGFWTSFAFSGPGVSGTGSINVGPDTVAGDPPDVLAIGGASGTFTDLNTPTPIVGARITGIVPINFTPTTDPKAPASFSIYDIASGVPGPPPSPGYSYDNLYWPLGSIDDCSDYIFFGGALDVYGMLLQLANGDVADLWSDGDLGFGPITYGVAVTDGLTVLDYQFSGVTAAIPEPASLGILGLGLLGLLARRRRPQGMAA